MAPSSLHDFPFTLAPYDDISQMIHGNPRSPIRPFEENVPAARLVPGLRPGGEKQRVGQGFEIFGG
jgi:hypothetical protein